jgi:hypothetical protein
MRRLLNLTAKTGDEILLGAGKSLDEVAEALETQLTSTGKLKVPTGKQARKADGTLVPKESGGYYSKWEDDWQLVDTQIMASIKAADNVALSKSRFTLNKIIPGAKTSYNLGVFAVVGGIAYNLLSVVGSLSDGLQETINNFFGLNCESDDIKCEENGARNQMILGMAIAGIGLVSLASFFGLGKKKEPSGEGA